MSTNSDDSVYARQGEDPAGDQATPAPPVDASAEMQNYVSTETFAPQFPLLDEDPDRVSDFWLDARLFASPAGTVFVAHEDAGDSVMLVLLSEGAAEDAAARSRFAGEINAMHIDTVVARGGYGQNEGRMKVRFHAQDGPTIDDALLAPWAALAFDGSHRAVAEAARVLHAVDLSEALPLSKPAGPDFRLHWIDRIAHGRTRSWLLPWPGRKDRAGWITMLTSFLLMALITALALLLAILLFQNQPLVQVPQPIPSPASGSGSPTSGSAKPSQSPSSADPSSGSSSDPSNEPAPYSDSPSMSQPSGSASGQGEPSTNRRL